MWIFFKKNTHIDETKEIIRTEIINEIKQVYIIDCMVNWSILIYISFQVAKGMRIPIEKLLFRQLDRERDWQVNVAGFWLAARG